MSMETILDDPKRSILIATSGELADIVIGVPHHAPLGVTQLPCKEHPDSDENAGLLGYYISRLLDCHSVIACNYFIDPNKDENSDYCKKIMSLKPKILVEIHGHGGRSAKFDIEISSGSLERNIWSQEIAERLRATLSNIPALQSYSLSGDFNEIYFKATNSFTITTDRWVAFHIELPKSIRESRDKYALFCELLAEAIKGLIVDFEKIYESNTNNESRIASNNDDELIDGLFSGIAVALDDTELDDIFSKSAEELADEIIQFAEDEKLISDDQSYLQHEIEDLFWSNKGVRLGQKPSHFKYRTVIKKAWLIASTKMGRNRPSDRFYRSSMNDLSNDVLADELLLFVKESKLGGNDQEILTREVLELFWKFKGIQNTYDVSAETSLKIKQVEKIARNKINAKILSVSVDQLSQELASFAKKKEARENGQGVNVKLVAHTFWRTKGLDYRVDSLEIDQRKGEVERFAQEIVDKDFHEWRDKRRQEESQQLPQLVQACVEWARSTGRNSVTIRDIKYFRLENKLDILEETERALYLSANNELKTRKKAS